MPSRRANCKENSDVKGPREEFAAVSHFARRSKTRTHAARCENERSMCAAIVAVANAISKRDEK